MPGGLTHKEESQPFRDETGRISWDKFSLTDFDSLVNPDRFDARLHGAGINVEGPSLGGAGAGFLVRAESVAKNNGR